MLRRDRQIQTQIHQLADACLVALSFWLAYLLRANATITAAPGTGHGPAVVLRFGPQTDTRPIRHDGGDLPGTGRKLSAQAVGNYIAKYATKTLEAPGLPDRRLTSRLEIEELRCSAHHRQMIATAWELGGGQLTPGPQPSRLCQRAHTLGHGGHFLTKSRRYSVTFGQLRHARTQHRRAQRHPDGERDPWGRPLEERIVLILATWAYDGTGYTAGPSAALALASADRARAHDQADRAA